jgi:DNA-binding transcriptional ArsR family regulator
MDVKAIAACCEPVLTGAGLVIREKRGKWAWYRVVPERLEVLRDALSVTGP